MAETQTKKENQETLTDKQILADLLSNQPANESVPLELPSRNKFYKLIDPGAPVEMRPMTFDDEKSMMSNKNPNVDLINSLLVRCVTNLNISEMLIFDKLYCIMKLRELSYGDEYKATITCPDCRKENEVIFNLSNLNTKHIDDDYTNPVTVVLPILQKTVKVRLPRIKDEQWLSNTETTSRNLWRFIEEVEGHTSKSVIQEFCTQLPLKDAHAIFKGLGAHDHGIDTRVRFACHYCSHNEAMVLPITADFFTSN